MFSVAKPLFPVLNIMLQKQRVGATGWRKVSLLRFLRQFDFLPLPKNTRLSKSISESLLLLSMEDLSPESDHCLACQHNAAPFLEVSVPDLLEFGIQ